MFHFRQHLIEFILYYIIKSYLIEMTIYEIALLLNCIIKLGNELAYFKNI